MTRGRFSHSPSLLAQGEWEKDVGVVNLATPSGHRAQPFFARLPLRTRFQGARRKVEVIQRIAKLTKENDELKAEIARAILMLLLIPQHFFSGRPAQQMRAAGKNNRAADQRRGGRERGNSVPGCRERSDRLARRSAAIDQNDAACYQGRSSAQSEARLALEDACPARALHFQLPHLRRRVAHQDR